MLQIQDGILITYLTTSGKPFPVRSTLSSTTRYKLKELVADVVLVAEHGLDGSGVYNGTSDLQLERMNVCCIFTCAIHET